VVSQGVIDLEKQSSTYRMLRDVDAQMRELMQNGPSGIETIQGNIPYMFVNALWQEQKKSPAFSVAAADLSNITNMFQIVLIERSKLVSTGTRDVPISRPMFVSADSYEGLITYGVTHVYDTEYELARGIAPPQKNMATYVIQNIPDVLQENPRDIGALFLHKHLQIRRKVVSQNLEKYPYYCDARN